MPDVPRWPALAPHMKCVREDYVAEQIVFRAIIDIKRGIELEIRCDVAGETDRGRVFRSALEIDLQTPPLVKVVGVAKDYFVFVARVNGSGDDFVMLRVVASFDKRLRIDVKMGRPIDESNGKKERLFSEQPDFRAKDPFVRLQPA